jgi:hypothetical protein
MGFLQERHGDRLRQRPQHIMRFPVEDYEPEHRQRIGRAIPLIWIGRAVRRDQSQLKHNVRFRWIRNQLVSPPTLNARIKFVIRSVWIAAERMRKKPAVGAGIRDEDGFCIEKRRRHRR